MKDLLLIVLIPGFAIQTFFLWQWDRWLKKSQERERKLHVIIDGYEAINKAYAQTPNFPAEQAP